MSNPLEEFLQEYGALETKEADARDFSNSNFGKALIGGLGAAAATAVIGGVGAAASKVMDAATKGRDFRRMLAFNPDLQEHHERDPRMFNQMYSSLRSMNPEFAKDPLVAGTYLRRMVESPLTAGGVLTDAVGARDKFPSLVSRATDEAIGASKGYFSPMSFARSTSSFDRGPSDGDGARPPPPHQDRGRFHRRGRRYP